MDTKGQVRATTRPHRTARVVVKTVAWLQETVGQPKGNLFVQARENVSFLLLAHPMRLVSGVSPIVMTPRVTVLRHVFNELKHLEITDQSLRVDQIVPFSPFIRL